MDFFHRKDWNLSCSSCGSMSDVNRRCAKCPQC